MYRKKPGGRQGAGKRCRNNSARLSFIFASEDLELTDLSQRMKHFIFSVVKSQSTPVPKGCLRAPQRVGNMEYTHFGQETVPERPCRRIGSQKHEY